MVSRCCLILPQLMFKQKKTYWIQKNENSKKKTKEKVKISSRSVIKIFNICCVLFSRCCEIFFPRSLRFVNGRWELNWVTMEELFPAQWIKNFYPASAKFLAGNLLTSETVKLNLFIYLFSLPVSRHFYTMITENYSSHNTELDYFKNTTRSFWS